MRAREDVASQANSMGEAERAAPEGLKIPAEIERVVTALASARFEAYPVGGCVRDLLLGRKPEDWDVATNATPEEVRRIFPESFYANKFFTVTVRTNAEDETLREIEVTTYRAEGRYGDKRHPAEVRPAETIEQDLARRDFTVNAMALRVALPGGAVAAVVDPYGGEEDLRRKVIRAVGNPERRFGEDALRLLRAARIASILGFAIEPGTAAAIRSNAGSIRAVSKERIRDEVSKLLLAEEPQDRRRPPAGLSAPTDVPGAAHPSTERLAEIGASRAWLGVELLRELGLLRHIVPELEAGLGVTQNKHHVYTVWEHNLRALDFAARNSWSLAVRIGALFHDIGKPGAKRGEGPDATFYGHDVLGARMTLEILSRLRYPAEFAEKVSKLVRWHLFRYDYGADPVQTTDSAIRRLIRNVGVENIEDLVRVRMCDRIGSGVPKAVPYRLRHFQYRVEKILREGEAVKVTMLQVRGDDVMGILGIPPGPTVGHVLNALLEEVLDDPAKNRREYLGARIGELGRLSDGELVALREKAEARLELLEDQREQEIKEKYYVQ